MKIDSYKNKITPLVDDLVNNKVISNYHIDTLKQAITKATSAKEIVDILEGEKPAVNHQDLIKITERHLKACQEYHTSYTNQQSYKEVTGACRSFLMITKELKELTLKASIKDNDKTLPQTEKATYTTPIKGF